MRTKRRQEEKKKGIRNISDKDRKERNRRGKRERKISKENEVIKERDG